MIVDTTNSQIKKDQNKDDNIKRAPIKSRRGYDLNAPKFPLTGYFRFMNEYKDKYRQQNPKLPLHEVTKLLAADWIKLPPATKQRYLDEAEKDKERYTKEMEEYQKAESFKYLFNSNINATQLFKKESLPAPVNQCTVEKVVKRSSEVAIFTQEFLQHNKARESELRQLRRQQGEVEDENALLTDRVHKLKGELQTEQSQVLLQRQNSTLMMQHLNLLKSTIALNLKGVNFPGCNDTVNPNNVESFLRLVCDMVKETDDDNDKRINSIDNEVVEIDKDDKSTRVISLKIDDSKKENEEIEKVDNDTKMKEDERERVNVENDIKKKSKKEFVNKVKCIIGNMTVDSK